MKRFNFTSEEGNILIYSVVITALLVATGMGYMRWAADERWDSAYEEATVQAFFLAQHGVIEQGLQYLRTRTPADLPQGTVHLPSKYVPGVGLYHTTKVSRVIGLGGADVFQRSDTYDVVSTGRVEFYDHQLGRRHVGRKARVERTATMRARLRSFANYMYLTNYETTEFNEIIWFWTYDSLWGRTHSNDYIGLKYSPHFYGPISTCQDHFEELQADPYFAYDPQFNVPPVHFPTTAATLRAGANPWINSLNGRMMTRLKMRGEGGIEVHQYVLGTPPKDSLINVIPPPAFGAVFVDGPCEVMGTVLGNMSIGSSGDMWLIDDIVYDGANQYNGDFEQEQMQHMLGLVSESNIMIRDNDANGRGNGWNNGSNPMQTSRHSIIICAGLVALNTSFSFEHMNDDFDSYQGPTPDERGIIHLRGAVTQWRRGYVHRSNHTGTGYGKDYRYDFRFDDRPPPFYLEAMDENGHGLFDILSWGERRVTR